MDSIIISGRYGWSINPSSKEDIFIPGWQNTPTEPKNTPTEPKNASTERKKTPTRYNKLPTIKYNKF